MNWGIHKACGTDYSTSDLTFYCGQKVAQRWKFYARRGMRCVPFAPAHQRRRRCPLSYLVKKNLTQRKWVSNALYEFRSSYSHKWFWTYTHLKRRKNPLSHVQHNRKWLLCRAKHILNSIVCWIFYILYIT